MVTRQVLGHRVPCQTLHARGFPTDGQFARPAGGLLRGPFLPHRALDATVPTVPAPRTGPLALPSAARAFHVPRATALAGSTPPDPGELTSDTGAEQLVEREGSSAYWLCNPNRIGLMQRLNQIIYVKCLHVTNTNVYLL